MSGSFTNIAVQKYVKMSVLEAKGNRQQLKRYRNGNGEQ